MDKFNALPLPQRILGVFAVMAGIFAIFYFVLVGGIESDVAAQQTKRTKHQKTLEEHKQELAGKAQLQAIQRAQKAQEDERDALRQLLPEEEEVPRLIYSIKALAENVLKIHKYVKRAPVPQDFVRRVPIEMEVEGRFPALLLFLDRINKLGEPDGKRNPDREGGEEWAKHDLQPRLVTVSDLTIKGVDMKDLLSKARKGSRVRTAKIKPKRWDDKKGGKAGWETVSATLAKYEEYEAALERATVTATMTINAYMWTGNALTAADHKSLKRHRKKRPRRRRR